MDFSFALLTIVCCILGVWAFAETRRNITAEKSNRDLLSKLNAGDMAGGYSEVLTVELAAKAVNANGYVPSIFGKSVHFKIQGETYAIYLERMPVVIIFKRYSLDRTEYDLDLLREAFHKTSDELIMVKAFVDEDGEGISFQIAALENCYGHFCDSLERYVGIIDNAVDLSRLRYHELEEARAHCLEAGHPEESLAASPSINSQA